jgi:hypothetical protein
MDDQLPEVVAEPVPPQAVEVTAPEPAETPEEKPVKTFTQEELDAIVAKRLAREQRKWERERVQKPVATAPKEVPPADQFESVEAYAEALAARKAEELLQQKEAQKRQAEVLEAYHDREEKARDKYADFQQVAYNPNLPVTNVMAQTIQASEIGPEIAYYLGSHPKEAERISKLSPFLQAKEIGKIEAKVADSPPVAKPTNAPNPITPVNARQSSAPTFDTTDPRSIKSMTTSQWIEAERQRQIRAWEAKNRQL